MSSPFEVIVVNDYASVTGGSSAVALASAIGLAARGIQVTLFTCVGPVAPNLQAVPGLKVICLDQPEIVKDENRGRAFINGIRNHTAVEAFRVELSSKVPDRTIIHIHTWMKALSPFVIDVALSLGFRVTLTLHDFFITCPSGGFFVHKTKTLCERKPLSMSCLRCNCDRNNYGHKLWRSARTSIQNKYLHIIDRVHAYIGVSDFSVQIMRPYMPTKTPVKIVRNPIEVPFSPRIDVAKNREFFFIGRFAEEKGVRLFAEAVQRTGLPATFIGDGELMPEIKKICPRARFFGWLQPDQVREKMKEARALVFPPLWYETLGMVAIEAAAAGVPALIASRCAATDHLLDGIHGLHFLHGSVVSLCERMVELSRNDALTDKLSQNAYEWYWDEPWTLDRHVEQLERVYQDIMVGHPILEPVNV